MTTNQLFCNQCWKPCPPNTKLYSTECPQGPHLCCATCRANVPEFEESFLCKLCKRSHSVDSMYELHGNPSLTLNHCDPDIEDQLCGYCPSLIQKIATKAIMFWEHQQSIALKVRRNQMLQNIQKYKVHFEKMKKLAAQQKVKMSSIQNKHQNTVNMVKESNRKYNELKTKYDTDTVGVQSLKSALQKHKVYVSKMKKQFTSIRGQNAKLKQSLNEKERQFGNLRVKYNEMAKKYRKRTRSPSNRSSAGSSGNSVGSSGSFGSMGSSGSQSNKRRKRTGNTQRTFGTIPETQSIGEMGIGNPISNQMAMVPFTENRNRNQHRSRNQNRRQSTQSQQRSGNRNRTRNQMASQPSGQRRRRSSSSGAPIPPNNIDFSPGSVCSSITGVMTTSHHTQNRNNAMSLSSIDDAMSVSHDFDPMTGF